MLRSTENGHRHVRGVRSASDSLRGRVPDSFYSDSNYGNTNKDTYRDSSDRGTQFSWCQEPEPPKGKWSVGKLKNAGESHQTSMTSNKPGHKADSPRKGAFDRLGGLFGRSNANKADASASHPKMELLRPVSSQEPISSHRRFLSWHSGRPKSNVEDKSSFLRPPEGYYAPFAPESFSRYRSGDAAAISSPYLPQQQSPEHDLQRRREVRTPSPAGSFTPSNRVSPRSPPAPQQQQLAPRSPRSPRPVSPHVPSPVASVIPRSPRSPPSRGRSQERSYTRDLHLRSRSPRGYPPRPEEKNTPATDLTDPANNLGQFRSNPRTSRIGDQERPWILVIPGESDDQESLTGVWRDTTTEQVLQSSQLPTYEEDAQQYNHPPSPPRDEKQQPHVSSPPPPPPTTTEDRVHDRHPHRGEARAINDVTSPVELPVENDDSSEEIIMSSTAYPGQEWRPLGLSEY